MIDEKQVAVARATELGMPDGWREVRFDEIAQLVNDRVDNPAEAGVERYVGLEHLDPESLKIRRWGVPTDVEAQKLRFQPGDIIFGKRRAYQRKVAVADFEGICSAHAMVLRVCEENVVKEFLPFFMQSDAFFDRAISISVGSLSPTINWKTLANQQFTIPSMEEQRRIADILSTTDKAGTEIIEAIATSTKVYELVSDELLTKGIGSKNLVDTAVGKIAQDWELKPLNSLVAEDAPIRYGIVQVGEHIHDGMLTLAIKDLFGDYRNSVHRTSKEREKKYIGSRVRPNDVLLSIKATVGRVDVVPEWFEGNISRDLARIRVNGELHPWFLTYLLRSPSYQRYIERYVVGSTRKELSIHALRKLLIPVPPSDEQLTIVHALDATQKAIKDSQAHYAKLMNLKRKLLTQLLPNT